MQRLTPVLLAAIALFLVNCTQKLAPAEEPVDADPAASEPAESSTSTTKSAPVGGKSDPKAPGTKDEPGAPSAKTFAEPLPSSEPGEWTWFGPEEFDDVPTCMDGSKTGLGVSLSPTGSKKVIIFMQGGGACFDGQTCALSDFILSASHHDEDDFHKWADGQGSTTILNRDRAQNPFRDWNYVFVPYCSGDVFSGSRQSGFMGRPQLGFENVAAYLPRMTSTFRDADQVVLTGTSAGGYGALWDYPPFQKAFDWVDLTVIDDSAPPFSSTFTDPCLQDKWRDIWGMEKTSPVDGPFPLGDGKRGLIEMVQQIVDAHPKTQFAFISHDDDIVMRYFHGIGRSLGCALPWLLSDAHFADALREVRSMKGDNFSTFYGPGLTHQYFKGDDEAFYSTAVDGISLAGWLGQLVKDGSQVRRVPASF